MAAIDISSSGGGALDTGILQLENGVAMDSTLRNVSDQNNTTSPLKLSTTAVQVVSPLRITTDDPSDFYLDCEDGSTNNRFSIKRNAASQQVNLDFASNPAGSTTTVGAIRTYVDGVNLSEVMTFREDGATGIVSQLYLGNTNSLLSNNRFQILNSANTAIMVNVDNNGSVSTNGRFQIYNSARTAIAQAMYYDGATMVFRPMNDGIENTRFSSNDQSKTMLRFDGVSGNVDVGTGTTLGARLGIKGSGSTSATTSLLVQNSAGTSLFSVRDDGAVIVPSFLSATSYIQTNGILIGNGNSRLYYLNSSNANLSINATGIVASTSGYSSSTASAVLEANSTTQGFLPPRMTNAQRAAITTPAVGLMVYCTDAVEGLYIYKSTGWTFVI